MTVEVCQIVDHSILLYIYHSDLCHGSGLILPHCQESR